MTAFNREPSEAFSLRNKPASFYIGTGKNKLFTDPVRDSFDRQIIPILYSETWGDYWAYFLVAGNELETGDPLQGGLLQIALKNEQWSSSIQTNRYEINDYLAFVNIIALFPTAIAVISAGWGLIYILRSLVRMEFDQERLHILLFLLVIISTLVGYLWFLVQYPTDDGDTIKATYIIQIYPFIALLVGLLGNRIYAQKRWVYWLLFGIYLLLLIPMKGAFITRTFG
jgi:hypothetical protein